MNICDEVLQFFFAAEDVFVVVALPDGETLSVAVGAAGNRHFIGAKDGANRSTFRAVRHCGGGCRGVPLGRPYGGWMNDNNAMDVIGHDDVGAQFDLWKMIGDGAPMFIGNPSHCRIMHFAVDDLTEQTLPLMGDKGDEIGAGL